MEPLEELFQLFEEETKKKEALNATISRPTHSPQSPIPMVGSPNGELENSSLHPEAAMKHQIDQQVESGLKPSEAHQQSYGEVNTKSIDSKANLAKTLGRFSNENNRGHTSPDPDSGSIFSQITKDTTESPVNDEILKTPVEQETPVKEELSEPEGVDIWEHWDYNDDAAYLRTYGRA